MKPLGQIILGVVLALGFMFLNAFIEYAATEPVLVFLIFTAAALCAIAWVIFETARPR